MTTTIRIPTTLLAAALALLAVSAAAAHAATPLRFTATLQAERTVTWDQPRGVSLIDCRGEHWIEDGGDESWKIKSKPFPVKITRFPRGAMWQFGDGRPKADPRDLGMEASGIRTRSWDQRSGVTGGWCGGAEEHKLTTDCGTRLPQYLLLLTAGRNALTWTASIAPWMDRERDKMDYYRCSLIVPDGLSTGEFPRLEGKFRLADLANRRKREITIKASKTFGPESHGVANLGVERTASGSASWTLTLRRR